MSITIAAAQCASLPGDIAQNLATHLRFCEAAALCGAHLVVFPELSLTGYELQLARANAVRVADPRLEPLHRFAVERQMAIVAGAPLIIDGKTLNIGALIYLPDGRILSYSKVHVHESEAFVFAAGFGGPLFEVREDRLALAICRDAAMPVHARDAAQHGASIYAAGVMITEADYARKSSLLRGYAVEYAMATLMANYAGRSGGEESVGRSIIFSEQGQIVAAVSNNSESLVVGAKNGNMWTGESYPLPR